MTEDERDALAELFALRRKAAEAIGRRLRTGPLTEDEQAAVLAYAASWRLVAARIRFLSHDDAGEAMRAVLGAQPTYQETPDRSRPGGRR
jgi:hypothetical protein